MSAADLYLVERQALGARLRSTIVRLARNPRDDVSEKSLSAYERRLNAVHNEDTIASYHA